ncbi:MAG: T9SS type A sorting domain-containing protein [Ignavibacteriaceae bacterium]
MKTILLFCLLTFFNLQIFSQYQNVRIDGPLSSQPEEVTIAINPVNPQVLAAGANINHFYWSTDSGLTWSEKRLTSSFGVWGDPCVVFDELGYLYYGHLSNPPFPGYWIDRIVVQRSTDNGETWNDGAGVGFLNPRNQDKEWIGVDMHSPLYKGNIYMTWTEFDSYGSSGQNDSSRIKFSKSTDRGINWTEAQTISDVSGNCIDSDNTVEGAVPCVGPNGEIYVSWAGPLGLLFDRSFDGGDTWGEDIFVSDMPGGWDFDIPGIYRANGFPVTACDTSSNSPFHGNIYINWSDQRNGTSNTDIFFSRSTDGGDNWTAPFKVNDDNTTRHQFFNWMTIDQTTGAIYIIFYDRRNTTNVATDVYVARSTDGGNSFENFKVSESSFSPNSGIFFGDYSNIAAFNKKVYPIWTRLDGNSLSIWTALIYDSTVVVPVELAGFTAESNSGSILLKWQTVSELNNQGFEVHRKKTIVTNKDSEWSVIGFVPGKGTSTELSDYRFEDKPFISGEYSYRLKQLDYDGSFSFSNEVDVQFITLSDFGIEQNYPNPFNPSTIIEYKLPVRSLIQIKVFDMLGKEIAVLVDEEKPEGIHEVQFNGEEFASGLYIYKMIVGNFEQTRKMMLIK